MKARKKRKGQIMRMDKCMSCLHEQAPGRLMCEKCGGFLVPSGKKMVS